MPRGGFWFANVTSAIVWAPMLIFVGGCVGDPGDRLIGSANTVAAGFGGLTIFGVVAVVWAMMKSAGRSLNRATFRNQATAQIDVYYLMALYSQPHVFVFFPI